MANGEKNIWERRRSESQTAYARFLFYRNLGPGRTLQAAWQAYHASVPDRTESDAGIVSGQWKQDSADYDWPARAAAWDVHNLTEASAAVVCDYVAVLQGAARKALEKLSQADFVIPDWESFLETIRALGEYIPREAVREVQRAGYAAAGDAKRRAG